MTNPVDEQLKAIFANVNEWLKFAETKSAVLIAANAAAGVGALTVLVQNWKDLATFWIVYLHGFVLFTVVSAIVALFALIPRTAAVVRQRREKPADTDNLLFAGHIAKYDADTFLSKLKNRFSDESGALGLQLDYAEQIVINSCIATTKYEIFRIASWFSLTAIVTPILSLLILVILNKLHKDLPRRLKKRFDSFRSTRRWNSNPHTTDD